jgi:D-glycero-alpha-D-manno-heptose-7-phosphate kinase
MAAIVACFNEFRTEKLGLYEIAEKSFEAERIELGVTGGWQDQYATVFGGLNFIELNFDRNLVVPLRVSQGTLNELEEALLLCHSGQEHGGSKVQTALHDRSESVEHQTFSKATTELAWRMRDDLLRGHISELGLLLHEGWMLKRSHMNGATSEQLDDIYSFARANGAQGGRLLGTGGGGYFLFYIEPFRWHEAAAALKSRGLSVQNIVLDNQGLRSWTVAG